MTHPDYALVTGASRGLGAYFALKFARRARNVVLVSRSMESLERLATELANSYGVFAEPVQCDLSRPEAGQRLVQELRKRQISVDLLVNNAGFGLRGEFRSLRLERQMEMMQVHHVGVVELTSCLLPYMIAKRRGGVINVASAAAFQPIPYAAVYAATKAFVASFSMALAEELRPYGIAVVTVCPGRLSPDSQTILGQSEKRKRSGSVQDRDKVVTAALRALDRGGGLVVPGAINKLAAFLEHLIPRRVLPGLVGKLSRPRGSQ